MLKVINSGIYTTLQDQGRFGFAHLGVPVSGCMDEVSANFANTILGNSITNAVLEITFGLAKFQFLSLTHICISGADFNPKLNGNTIELNKPIKVKEKDVLSFGSSKVGVRCYLAVKNGFQTDEVLSSKSQYQNVTEKNIIHKNDILFYQTFTDTASTLNAKIRTNTSLFTSKNLLCSKGPEFNLLSKKQREILFTTLFTISKDNNRMGYRFNEIIPNNFSSILTSAVLPGTVQLTPSGKIIVLMKDCQVTGGYPRVLQLTKEAIAILAQKSTNQNVNFQLSKV